MAQHCNSFCSGFNKVATGIGTKSIGSAGKVLGMHPETAKRVGYGLEQGGLGALAATDAYHAYKAHKKGEKGERNSSLTNIGALSALMGATYLAHKA